MNYLNGVQRNKEHPDTFYVPDREMKAAIIPGQFVKIGIEFPPDVFKGLGHKPTGCERCWVQVTEVDVEAGKIKGLINNDLVCTTSHGLKCDDPVEIEFDHVLDILS